jgi:hypothetical protein
MDATNQALLGEVLIDAGRWLEAWDALVEGEKIIDGLLVEDPGNGIVLDLDVSTLTLEAVVLHHGARVEPARERCRKAFDAATTLLRKDPATEQSIDDLPKLRREARALGVPDPYSCARRGTETIIPLDSGEVVRVRERSGDGDRLPYLPKM